MKLKIILSTLSLLLTQVFASSVIQSGDLNQEIPSKSQNYTSVDCLGDQELTLHALAFNKFADPTCVVMRLATQSNWNHVAMVFADRNDPENEDKWWVFQATSDAGVHLNQWLTSDFKNNERTIQAAFRSFNYSSDFNQPDTKIWKDIINTYIGKPYTSGAEILVEIASVFKANRTEVTDSYFCSQLAAQALIDAGFLKKEARLAVNYTPADFSQAMDAKIPFVNGVGLSSEKIVYTTELSKIQQIGYNLGIFK